ncbi:uracil-DNA glycosylase family protein [Roseospirillum parvum]|uniref:Uracil-DNA glycosylase n=1 Tax=Roseospirillum parvum TaxID=83401 RepID=A0A1G7ZK54_9PROT|nr:uracil-DNA glycosylase family protein [Roseospirillum parvum]SDH09019.1 Uracil-DNA glycosylase [Roseospirillum parvum]
MPPADDPFARLAAEARACTACAPHLPHAPRPVLKGSSSARLLIVGQAPGRRVHETGIPWNDPSGQRLRAWLGLSPQTFYDESRVAIVPMGLCYPGTQGRADAPPRPECAPLWQARARAALPNLDTTLLVGSHAQRFHLHSRSSMTDTVRAFADLAPTLWPLPHPSWRNNAWLKHHPWFETDLLPALRRHLAQLLTA